VSAADCGGLLDHDRKVGADVMSADHHSL
jgi:hypothetical protein